ncbi:Holliday junction resolvase RuvX [Marinilabiliaceae bacterium ANBcel2]|nr:Holliday junction resolvase RuvX [Marinilabiliaceae bacterium ANBcel2]
MGRILAFDVGQKRVGIAATDSLKIIANGLTTVAIHEAHSFLKEYIEKEDVEAFVVGHAKKVTGEESASMEYINPFVRSLKNKYRDIPVYFMDERFTSKLALRAMIDGGMKKGARRDKGMVDKISATIILQSFLESQNRI